MTISHVRYRKNCLTANIVALQYLMPFYKYKLNAVTKTTTASGGLTKGRERLGQKGRGGRLGRCQSKVLEVHINAA